MIHRRPDYETAAVATRRGSYADFFAAHARSGHRVGAKAPDHQNRVGKKESYPKPMCVHQCLILCQ